jgi:hypothetical protein
MDFTSSGHLFSGGDSIQHKNGTGIPTNPENNSLEFMMSESEDKINALLLPLPGCTEG